MGGGELCQETDCGNTWSPNVILPREFLRVYVTDTYALVHTKSQSSAVSSVKRRGGGYRTSGPKGGFGALRCKADVYHS